MVVRFDRTHLSWPESRNLGSQLAEARRASGVSLGGAARRLGLPEATFRAYEEGRSRFPLRLIFAAARLLQLSPYHLLAGRADRVLNPWEPNVKEWHRLGRLGGPLSEDILRGKGLEEEPFEEQIEWEAEENGAEVMKDGRVDSFLVLRGNDAERALQFLDEQGPSAQLKEEEDW